MTISNNYFHYGLALIGFLVANALCLIFSGQFEGDRSDKSIFLNFFGQQIHLHHWMYGLIGLIILLVLEQKFGKQYWLDALKGFSFGLIFHGLSFYEDYFKVLK